jgi:thiamine biosynthesis lipoprotein
MTDRSSFSWRPSRRDVLFLGIGGMLAAVPLARRRPLALVRRSVPVMGTIAEFALAHDDSAKAQAAIDAAIRALQQVDESMSRFRMVSDVGRANRQAARIPTTISRATAEVLGAGLRWAEDSDGRFDPCLGRAITVWDVGHRHEPPAAAEVARVANRQLYRALEIGSSAGRPAVIFHHDDVQIDLGGIAKGYGVDRAAAALREHGIENALIGAGGDLYALGRSPAGEPWHVGIQSPDRPDALAGSLYLENQAVATSGDYQQYFEYRNRRYHHLLDPETGEPRLTRRRSVSVVAETCMDADAGATLAFVGEPSLAGRVLARRGGRIAHSI